MNEETALHLQDRLTNLADKHNVPGAALGILHEDRTWGFATGVLGLDTQISATPDSLFKIGSVTKVWTAVLIMQLVDEGKLHLDQPVVEVLPDFLVADPDATRRITVRQLLTHSSGIDGDIYVNTGRGDDALRRYVELLATVPQLHPPGEGVSYSNAGFNVAGRIVEQVTGDSWEAALHERIVARLGLTSTVVFGEDAVLHRTAVGHLVDGDGRTRQTRSWSVPRSSGPSAAIAASTGDLLAFARVFLADGQSPSGEQILTATSAAEMVSTQVTVPLVGMGLDSWGLGWLRSEWSGERVFGHDGASSGQRAMLRVVPSHDFAVAVFANGGGVGFLRAVLETVAHDLTGLELPQPLSAPTASATHRNAPPTLDPVGTYRRSSEVIDIERSGDSLIMKTEWIGALVDGEEAGDELTEEHRLVHVDGDLYLATLDGSDRGEPVTIMLRPDGRRLVHHRMRATPLA